MWAQWLWLAALWSLCASAASMVLGGAVPGAAAVLGGEDETLPPSLGCNRRFYRALVEQADEFGRRCRDVVNHTSCWGRCDSHETTDWQFPYKRSHHPVCVHGARRPATTVLSDCDPGVQPGTEIYRYMEAKSCRCQICSSSDTSCEWLPVESNELTSNTLHTPYAVILMNEE